MSGKHQTVQKHEFWLEHVSNWQQSGLSQAEYCRRANISVKSFGHWKRRVDLGTHSLPEKVDMEPRQDAPVIVPISFNQSISDIHPEPIRLHVGKRYRVDIHKDFCSTVLEKLLLTLERVL